ncbi:MAG: hypothetical protein IPH45_21550 [Bacteroidales bacterium]|nr:hypothetical protein [Bacteroidales bacterium]
MIALTFSSKLESTKMENIDQDNFIINSDSKDELRIKNELIQIINFQLNKPNIHLDFPDILLWIDNTNGYISCHRYNFYENMTNEEDCYSVLELPDFFEEIIEGDNEESFYDKILLVLSKIESKDLVDGKLVKLYETSEINNPKLLIIL